MVGPTCTLFAIQEKHFNIDKSKVYKVLAWEPQKSWKDGQNRPKNHANYVI